MKTSKIEITIDKKISLGVILYSLLYTIPKTHVSGKMGRKNIMKAIKKQLKIFYIQDEKKYLDIVKKSDKILNEVKELLELENKEEIRWINPGAILKILKNRYSNYIDIFELKESHIKNIVDGYINDGSNNTFISVKYVNKIIERINFYN